MKEKTFPVYLTALDWQAVDSVLAQSIVEMPGPTYRTIWNVGANRVNFIRSKITGAIERHTQGGRGNVEGFFATVKRGLDGIYHSVSRERLPLYLNEFEFRYNRRHLDDGDRTCAAIKAAQGKRLYYKDPK